MIRRPPRSTRTDTLFPYTTLFRSTDFNIGLNWRLTPRWSLSAAFYQSRGSRRSPFILDPLVTETPFISLPRNRSVFLTLRYERSAGRPQGRSEEHTSELQSLMRISYAVFCLKKKKTQNNTKHSD